MAGVANAQTYTAFLTPAQEVPASGSAATGYGRVFINESTLTLSFTVVFNGLAGTQTAAHIHNAAIGVNGPVIVNFGTVGGTAGTITGSVAVTALQIANIRDGVGYINVHSTLWPGGEIRGQLGLRRPLDFDGDGQTDYSVLRFPSVAPPGVSQITQYNLNSTTGFQSAPWGDANVDYPAPGDYDGDGKDDLCVYRAGASVGSPSYFFILRSSDAGIRVVQWGTRGDQPVARDYDGDGITDIAVFRPGASAGAPAYWWILQSRTSTLRAVPFGTTGNGSTTLDVAVPQDYDGDGTVDLAVYRVGMAPANTFIVLRSSDGQVRYNAWGNFNTDWLVPGDYDGDGKADFAVARTGASGSTPLVWFILQTSNGALRVATFGLTSDIPAPGDYDGDGKTDITVSRSSGSKVFYTTGSFASAFIVRQWGIVGDFVVAQFSVR
jgi:hypothetical protein